MHSLVSLKPFNEKKMTTSLGMSLKPGALATMLLSWSKELSLAFGITFVSLVLPYLPSGHLLILTVVVAGVLFQSKASPSLG